MFNKKISFFLLPIMTTTALYANDPINDPFFNDPFGDDIFKEMMQMQKNMDQMFERMHQRMKKRSSGLVSPLGTYKMAAHSQFVDKGDHYELTTNIPESKENHININTANGIMSITTKIVHEQENKNGNAVSRSSSVRMYQQSMTLPNDTDEGTIKTKYKNGKLIVSINKKNMTTVQSAAVKKEPKKTEEKKQIQKEETNTTKERNITINSDMPSMS